MTSLGAAENLLPLEVVGLNGSPVLATQLPPTATVAELKAAVAESEAAVPASMQCLLLGARLLDSDRLCIGDLAGGDGSQPLVLQLMVSDAVMRWCPDTTAYMQLSEDGLRTEKIRGGPSGWGSVFAKDPLPRQGRCCWKFVVETVASCGDVIVGVVNPDSDEAFSYVVVGNPSGMLGINSAKCNFGGSTTTYMRYKQENYGRAVAWSSASAVGLEITSLWCQGALSFALNGEGLGVAFRLGEGESDLPHASGDRLVPFVTCYGAGTKVTLDPAPDCDEMCLEAAKPASSEQVEAAG